MSKPQAGLTVPSHVPPDRILDFDIALDPGLRTDPFERLRELRDRSAKVMYSPRNGGHWMVFGQKEQQRIFTESQTFSSKHLNGAGRGPGFIPLGLDPPEHAPWRTLLFKHFGPAHVRALEPFIRSWAERQVAKLDGATSCDFLKAVAEPVPVSVFMVIMGLPLERFDEFRGLVTSALTPPEKSAGFLVMFFWKIRILMMRMMGFRKIVKVLKELIAARKLEPKDDLVSKLLAETVQGRAITDAEMMSMCFLLFLAGLDTVTNAVTYGMRHLAKDQVLQDQIRKDPSIIPQVSEKMLRLYTFVNTTRKVIRDTEMDGVQIKAGEMVYCIQWAGSNEAGGETEGPRHMAFGGGHHMCLGVYLARLELRVMYEAWFERMGRFTLAPDDKPAMRGGSVMSISRLLLNLEPKQPAVSQT
jgi:cytochrome P450